ncbi:MAG: type II toxin-antitoxin system VapB family antitoxin [Cyclobacteriaceae bacterium]
MRTTLDLPEELIKEALEITGAKTKSQLIKDALENQIRQIKRQRLLTFKGKIDLDVDLGTTRKRS